MEASLTTAVMKNNRHGQAKILTPDEITRLFSEGLTTARDRALFGICLYTACRINEACSLLTSDVYGSTGAVRERLTIRWSATKGKQETRSIPVSPDLRSLVQEYQSNRPYLFPGRHGLGHINPRSAAAILRDAFNLIGVEGASTHSFRRTAITRLSSAKVPLRVIQTVSGHKSLNQLQRYIEVSEAEREAAIAVLSF